MSRPPPPPPVPDAVQQTGSGDGVAVTLLIRHLPEGLPADTLKRIFFYYGASDFRPCEAGRLKHCAFVDFNDEGVAGRAQSQLHRLQFLGKILTVERAKPIPGKIGTSQDGAKKENTERGSEMPPPPPYPPPPEEPPLPQATASAQTGSAMAGGEPIAPTLGVDYPFPPHLMYAYPPPDGNILTNIVNTLIAVPRFYTQVLHLMNKMNLPAPFRPALPTPPLPPPVPHPAAGKRQAGDLSSGESELESSDEDNNAEVMDEETERSEKEADSHQARSKRAKLEAVLGPAVDKGASHEAAGVKPINIIPKSSLIKKNKPVMQIKITPKSSAGEAATEKNSQEVLDTFTEELEDSNKTTTRAELEAGKVARTELLSLSVFKNYSAGNPTQVLYIKNLAKEVAPEDLFYVFGAFFASLEDAKAALSVKLMQEGRMRGQAFVTFPSVQSAEDALAVTHGFVLKGKPMVVQFGRNPSATK